MSSMSQSHEGALPGAQIDDAASLDFADEMDANQEVELYGDEVDEEELRDQVAEMPGKGAKPAKDMGRP